MPPPKKPKNGPTSVEQFLSREELQKMEEDSSEAASTTPTKASPSPGDSRNSSPAGKESGGGGDNGGGSSRCSSVGGEGSGEGDALRKKRSSPLLTLLTTPIAVPGTTSPTSSSARSLSSAASTSPQSACYSAQASRQGEELGDAAAGAGSLPPTSPNCRGLLRQLFAVKQDVSLDTQGPTPSLAPPLPPPPPPPPLPPHGASRGLSTTTASSTSPHNQHRKRNSERVTESGGGGGSGSGGQRDWSPQTKRSKVTSGTAADLRGLAAFPHQRLSAFKVAGGGGGGVDGSGAVQGEGAAPASGLAKERSGYLTSLIKDSPPASSPGAMAPPYFERVALNSGKLLHGLMAGPAPPTYIHAAFQLPLMDTGTSGHDHAMTGPVNTSMLAFLAAQGAVHHRHPHSHPHTPLPALPSLPRCCGPSSSLPLVDAAITAPLTSFSSLHPPSLPLSSSSSSPAAVVVGSAVGGGLLSSPASSSLSSLSSAQPNEPFDLSMRGPCGSSSSGGSEDLRACGSSGSGSRRPGGSISDLATGISPSCSASSVFASVTSSLSTSTTSNHPFHLPASVSTSPAIAGTLPSHGDGASSPSLANSSSRGVGLTQAAYLMNLRAGRGGLGSPSYAATSSLSSPGGKLFELAGSMAAAIVAQTPFSAAASSLPQPRPLNLSPLAGEASRTSPNR